MVAGGPPAGSFTAAALALAVTLWMRLAERGEEDAWDDQEDEDQEEVVVFRGCGLCLHAGGGTFAGCGGLRCRYRKEDGGHLIGLRVEGGSLAGPGRDLVTWWDDLVGDGVWGSLWGCDLSLLGSAKLGSCNVGGRVRQRLWAETVRAGCIRSSGG